MAKRKHMYSPLYKNFLSLKVNPLNDRKFLKLINETIYNKYNHQLPVSKKWMFVKNTNKEKWQHFIDAQIKHQSFFNLYKPYTHYAYPSSKFASLGNSFKKKFKNDLLTRIKLHYLYGGLTRKYLKLTMTKVYRHNNIKSSISVCTELFESRLDSILYRTYFCKSIRSAQQAIRHKHVKVNNHMEKQKSHQLKKGDLITFSASYRKSIKKNLRDKLKNCSNSILWPLPPKYLTVNYSTLEILIGDISDFNFSNTFHFKPDMHSAITSNYRN